MYILQTSSYFESSVRKRRPYLRDEWLIQAREQPIYKEAQPNGRMRHFIYIAESDKYLRVVFEGEIVHNAFLDRRFKPTKQ